MTVSGGACKVFPELSQSTQWASTGSHTWEGIHRCHPWVGIHRQEPIGRHPQVGIHRWHSWVGIIFDMACGAVDLSVS